MKNKLAKGAVCLSGLNECAGLEHDVTEVSYKKTDFFFFLMS